MRQRIQYLVSHPLFKSGTKMGAFLASGFPAFLIAIPLNWVLVKRQGWNSAAAYALVLVIQVIINFFMCRWFVFRENKAVSLRIQFCQFVSGILFFRLADWALYTVLVSGLGLYFLAVQAANTIIFAVMKYNFSRRVMEGKTHD